MSNFDTINAEYSTENVAGLDADAGSRGLVHNETIIKSFNDDPCNGIQLDDVIDTLIQELTDKKPLIQSYLKNGWLEVSKAFNTHTSLNSTTEEAMVDHDDIKLLGDVREIIVARVFECYKENDVHIRDFGSRTLTSDYDNTLFGPNSCYVMWNMFESFLKHYKKGLATALDVNLYNNGMYLLKGSNDLEALGMRKIEFDSDKKDGAGKVIDTTRVFTVTPTTDAGEHVMLTWATVKVLEGMISLKHRNDVSNGITKDDLMDQLLQMNEEEQRNVLSDIINNATPTCMEPYKEYLQGAIQKLIDAWRIRKTARELARHFFSAETCDMDNICNDEDIKIIAEYGIQFHFARLLNKVLYTGFEDVPFKNDFLDGLTEVLEETDRIVEGDIHKLLCRNMYFSLEAAYTNGTVNVVVHEMQARVANLNLEKADYVCSMIENYGELIKHISSASSKDPAQDVLKYSKYLYRIVYAATKLHDTEDENKDKLAAILNVVKSRGTGIVPDMTDIFYNAGDTIDDYLSQIQGTLYYYFTDGKLPDVRNVVPRRRNIDAYESMTRWQKNITDEDIPDEDISDEDITAEDNLEQNGLVGGGDSTSYVAMSCLAAVTFFISMIPR